jgi:hypothetical protein
VALPERDRHQQRLAQLVQQTLDLTSPSHRTPASDQPLVPWPNPPHTGRRPAEDIAEDTA